MPRNIISPITTSGIHSNTERSVLPKPSSSNGLRSDSMKVSLAALRINAMPATIRPALKGAMVGHSRRKVCHVERSLSLCIQKPAFVEIAAYSTRYPRTRQTTDDTSEVKFDPVSLVCASPAEKTAAKFALVGCIKPLIRLLSVALFYLAGRQPPCVIARCGRQRRFTMYALNKW